MTKIRRIIRAFSANIKGLIFFLRSMMNTAGPNATELCVDTTLLASGHTENSADKPFLVAINIGDGSELWKHHLPAEVVKGGTAVNAKDRIFVTLENGQLMCFTGPNAKLSTR